jgi:hypothetical protein
VALQVDAAQPADVTQQRQIEPHHSAEEGGILGETAHRVAGEAACGAARSSQFARLICR